RTDELPPGHPVLAWLAELARAPGAIRIDLGRLNVAAAERQLAAIHAGPLRAGAGRATAADGERQLAAIHEGPLPHELLRSIWKRSGGHPMFAEELLATADDPSGSEVPDSLVDVLLTRVSGLDGSALSVVRGLAVAGRPVDERLLESWLGEEGAEVAAPLRDAPGRGVLTTLPDGRHGFRHELLREI